MTVQTGVGGLAEDSVASHPAPTHRVAPCARCHVCGSIKIKALCCRCSRLMCEQHDAMAGPPGPGRLRELFLLVPPDDESDEIAKPAAADRPASAAPAGPAPRKPRDGEPPPVRPQPDLGGDRRAHQRRAAAEKSAADRRPPRAHGPARRFASAPLLRRLHPAGTALRRRDDRRCDDDRTGCCSRLRAALARCRPDDARGGPPRVTHRHRPAPTRSPPTWPEHRSHTEPHCAQDRGSGTDPRISPVYRGPAHRVRGQGSVRHRQTEGELESGSSRGARRISASDLDPASNRHGGTPGPARSGSCPVPACGGRTREGRRGAVAGTRRRRAAGAVQAGWSRRLALDAGIPVRHLCPTGRLEATRSNHSEHRRRPRPPRSRATRPVVDARPAAHGHGCAPASDRDVRARGSCKLGRCRVRHRVERGCNHRVERGYDHRAAGTRCLRRTGGSEADLAPDPSRQDERSRPGDLCRPVLRSDPPQGRPNRAHRGAVRRGHLWSDPDGPVPDRRQTRGSAWLGPTGHRRHHRSGDEPTRPARPGVPCGA